MKNRLIKSIIQQLHDVQDGPLWIDEHFTKKINHLSEEQVFLRPVSDLHSVAEVISHLLEWRKGCIARLKGESTGITEESPENWKTNEELKKIGWRKLKKDFYASQFEIILLLEDKKDSFLETEYVDSHSYTYLLEGMIHHDLYHLGQLGIIIKLLLQKENTGD